MKTFHKALVVSASVFSVCSVSAAADAPRQRDVVELGLRSDGRILGEPRMELASGREARMATARYRVTVTSTAVDGMADGRMVRIALALPTADGWRTVATPEVTTRLGQSVSVSSAMPGHPAVRIDLKVTSTAG